jgi:hypothetical protein
VLIFRHLDTRTAFWTCTRNCTCLHLIAGILDFCGGPSEMFHGLEHFWGAALLLSGAAAELWGAAAELWGAAAELSGAAAES